MQFIQHKIIVVVVGGGIF